MRMGGNQPFIGRLTAALTRMMVIYIVKVCPYGLNSMREICMQCLLVEKLVKTILGSVSSRLGFKQGGRL